MSMPIFDYRCDTCKKVVEEFVKRHDDVVVCEECGNAMVKLLAPFRFSYKAGDFFEAYVDTDIHPDGKPIPIRTKEEFFTQCRKHGRGYRKISDRMR
jgi:putative FmdB family regulatory protein